MHNRKWSLGMAISPPFREEVPVERPGSGIARLIRGHIRSIRVDAQDLRRSLTAILGTLDQPRVKRQAVRAAIVDEQQFKDENVGQIDARLSELKNLLAEYHQTGTSASGEIDDDLTAMENAWRRAIAAWPSAEGDADSLELLSVRSDVAEAKKHLDELIFIAARLTIPSRLREALRGQRVGGRLDFHLTYGDELPSEDDRKRLLEYLARYPATVGGIIDVDSGIIRVYSPKGWRRTLSYVAFTLALVGGAALLLALAQVGPQFGLMFNAALLPEHMVAYLAIVAGAFIHVAVDIVKEFRSAGGSTRFVAVEDMTLWGHVHELQILVSILSLSAVTIGAVALNLTEPHVAFLVGYSWDSFFDIFLGRFTTKVTDSTTALQQRLNAAAAVP